MIVQGLDDLFRWLWRGVCVGPLKAVVLNISSLVGEIRNNKLPRGKSGGKDVGNASHGQRWASAWGRSCAPPAYRTVAIHQSDAAL